MERRKLSDAEIEEKLTALNDWKVDEAQLKKRFEFENFAAALDFVNRAGEIAERRDHHPDICFGWGYAAFALTTHDRGGLTDWDFAVAREIDDLAA